MKKLWQVAADHRLKTVADQVLPADAQVRGGLRRESDRVSKCSKTSVAISKSYFPLSSDTNRTLGVLSATAIAAGPGCERTNQRDFGNWQHHI